VTGRRSNLGAVPILAAVGAGALTWLGVVVVEPQLAVSGILTRGEIWRLAVFTEAVLVLLGSLSVWISRHLGSRGAREVAAEAVYGDAGTGEEEENDGSGAGPSWVTAFGLWLLMIYAAAWLFIGLR